MSGALTKAHLHTHKGAQKEKGNLNNALELLPGPPQEPSTAPAQKSLGHKGRGEPDTRTQRRDTLPASLPGLALHSLSLRHETHPGESTLPLGLRYAAALGMEQLMGCRGRAFGHYTTPLWSATQYQWLMANSNHCVMVNFSFISFIGWALDTMHEESNNEIIEKKSPQYCLSPPTL